MAVAIRSSGEKTMRETRALKESVLETTDSDVVRDQERKKNDSLCFQLNLSWKRGWSLSCGLTEAGYSC